jgi:HAD superfamily hydrolase (TIGR01484 family)
MPLYNEIPTDVLANKKIVVADLDGTLAESKLPIDKEMVEILSELIKYIPLAVIGGGSYEKFSEQLISKIPKNSNLSKLYLFPTNATTFFSFSNGEWKKVYELALTEDEKAKIISALNRVISMFDFAKPKKIFGKQIEDRQTQITFSALGQNAPIEEKRLFDPNFEKRKLMKAELEKLIPEFEIRLGGMTSIDITRKGIDKAYGIMKISEQLLYRIEEMLYIGDALFEGGNDYAALRTGVDCVQINSISDTKRLLRKIIGLQSKEI